MTAILSSVSLESAQVGNICPGRGISGKTDSTRVFYFVLCFCSELTVLHCLRVAHERVEEAFADFEQSYFLPISVDDQLRYCCLADKILQNVRLRLY